MTPRIPDCSNCGQPAAWKVWGLEFKAYGQRPTAHAFGYACNRCKAVSPPTLNSKDARGLKVSFTRLKTQLPLFG